MLSFKGMLKQGWASYRDARIKILAVKHQPGRSNISRQARARFKTLAIWVQLNFVPFGTPVFQSQEKNLVCDY
jgi:hypothetical protein